MQTAPESFSTQSEKTSRRRKHVADQLTQLSKRAVLLRSAMTALYSAIGLLVGTSILVGSRCFAEWQYSSLPRIVGFAGACALLYATLLLVREARLALFTTVEEVAFARKAALEGEEQKKIKEKSRKI